MIQTFKPPAPQPGAPLFAAPPPLNSLQQLAALIAPPQGQPQQGSGSPLGGLDLGSLAQMMKGDGGKPDPTFGYGVGNFFSNYGIGSSLPTSQATGALGSNSPGGFGFGASY